MGYFADAVAAGDRPSNGSTPDVVKVSAALCHRLDPPRLGFYLAKETIAVSDGCNANVTPNQRKQIQRFLRDCNADFTVCEPTGGHKAVLIEGMPATWPGRASRRYASAQSPHPLARAHRQERRDGEGKLLESPDF